MSTMQGITMIHLPSHKMMDLSKNYRYVLETMFLCGGSLMKMDSWRGNCWIEDEVSCLQTTSQSWLERTSWTFIKAW